MWTPDRPWSIFVMMKAFMKVLGTNEMNDHVAK